MHGFKKVYISGLIFYTLGSVLAGQSHSLFEMILFRSAQGIGEGLIIPAGQAMIQMSFSKEERGRAMGIYALGMSFAPGLGPTIGGIFGRIHILARYFLYKRSDIHFAFSLGCIVFTFLSC